MRCLWCHKDVDAGWTLCPDCGGEDDQWTLLPTDGRLPIAVLALVALLVVCAARFARPPRTAAAGDPRRSGAPFLDLLR